MNELNFVLAFAAKPAVLGITAYAMIRIGRDRGQPGAAALVLGLGVFLLGELLCGLDMYVVHRMTVGNEAGHDTLMALAAGVVLVGVYDHVRARYRCVVRRCDRYWSCRLPAAACVKSDMYGTMPFWGFAATALLAAIPIMAAPGVTVTDVPVGFGDTVVGTYLFDRGPAIARLEQVVLPGVGAVLVGGAAVIYARARRLTRSALWLAAMGAGLVGFAYFRAILVHLFPHAPTLGAFWEEILEGMALILLLVWWRAETPGGDHEIVDDAPAPGAAPVSGTGTTSG